MIYIIKQRMRRQNLVMKTNNLLQLFGNQPDKLDKSTYHVIELGTDIAAELDMKKGMSFKFNERYMVDKYSLVSIEKIASREPVLIARGVHNCHVVIIKSRQTDKIYMLHVSPASINQASDNLFFEHIPKKPYRDLKPIHLDGNSKQKASLYFSDRFNPKELDDINQNGIDVGLTAGDIVDVIVVTITKDSSYKKEELLKLLQKLGVHIATVDVIPVEAKVWGWDERKAKHEILYLPFENKCCIKSHDKDSYIELNNLFDKSLPAMLDKKAGLVFTMYKPADELVKDNRTPKNPAGDYDLPKYTNKI